MAIEKLISIDLGDKELEAYRDRIRARSNKETHAMLISKYPTVKALEDNIQIFKMSGYDDKFKMEVSWWVENVLMNLYILDKDNITDEFVAPFIKNFEWYNHVINLFIRERGFFLGEFFNLGNPNSPDKKMTNTSDNIDLAIEILNSCRSSGMTRFDLNQYKERKKYLTKFKKHHKSFIDNLHKDVMGMFLSNLKSDQLRDIETKLADFVSSLERDLIAEKPKKAEYYSQKHSNLAEYQALSVVKIIYKYLEKHFKVDGKIIVRKYFQLLEYIANSLIMDLEDRKYTCFDEDYIKGILKKGQI